MIYDECMRFSLGKRWNSFTFKRNLITVSSLGGQLMDVCLYLINKKAWKLLLMTYSQGKDQSQVPLMIDWQPNRVQSVLHRCCCNNIGGVDALLRGLLCLNDINDACTLMHFFKCLKSARRSEDVGKSNAHLCAGLASRTHVPAWVDSVGTQFGTSEILVPGASRETSWSLSE